MFGKIASQEGLRFRRTPRRRNCSGMEQRLFLASLTLLVTSRLRSTTLFLVLALAMSAVVLPSLSLPAHAVTSYRAGLVTGDNAYYELSGNYGFSPTNPETQMRVLSV